MRSSALNARRRPTYFEFIEGSGAAACLQRADPNTRTAQRAKNLNTLPGQTGDTN
ncbi:hypothetical protein [Acidocella sp.]|jgi:hypothetical protein|uniref:hypothetical protein n=1 Tax=Acidocella sp. TaxID=50710 RepID=UPI002F3F004A